MHRRLLPGVFLGSAAISEGLLTRRQLRERSYRRLVQGVYAVPSSPWDHRLTATGVALVLPSGAAIGGLSAAAWHGAPVADRGELVTVVRASSVSWSGPRGVRVHRTDLVAGDVETYDGTPVTTPVRTAWDIAAIEPTGTAVAALDAMVRAGTVGEHDLAALLRTGNGRRGVVRARRAFPLVDARAESPPESRVRVALVLAGLEPVPQYEVRLEGALLARTDLAFPAARVAIEYEGAYHFDGTQIVRDDERIARLTAAGWTVIRLSAADLRDLDGVIVRVRVALAAR